MEIEREGLNRPMTDFQKSNPAWFAGGGSPMNRAFKGAVLGIDSGSGSSGSGPAGPGAKGSYPSVF